MSGDVGSQYTPTAGWAQAITYHRDVLGDDEWRGSIGVALGGEGSVATNGFWSALTMATTLKLPMLFYIEDNGLGISVTGEMQTPGGNIARNLAAFGNLSCAMATARTRTRRRAAGRGVAHVRSGTGPALVRLTMPRLSSHSGPDNQRGYRTEAEIAADARGTRCRGCATYLVPARLSPDEWADSSVRSSGTWARLWPPRARGPPDPAGVGGTCTPTSRQAPPKRWAACPARSARRSAAPTPAEDGELLRFAEAVRRTLRHELQVNPKVVVFGEDVGRKGGVHLVTEGLQKEFGPERVFDTSLSEEGIIGRAVGMAISG
jgi:2-oxoisovalerate dehydrogenase E1 component